MITIDKQDLVVFAIFAAVTAIAAFFIYFLGLVITNGFFAY